jgi:hypothetical protein
VKLRATPLLLALGLVLVMGSAPARAQKPQAERPTYVLGERWVRNDGVYELVRIEGGHYVFVSLQELYEYVEQQVSAKSRSVGGNQHSVMKGELEGALPLVRVKSP